MPATIDPMEVVVPRVVQPRDHSRSSQRCHKVAQGVTFIDVMTPIDVTLKIAIQFDSVPGQFAKHCCLERSYDIFSLLK